MSYKNWAYGIYNRVRITRDHVLAGPARWLNGLGVTADMVSLTRLVLVFPLFYFVGTAPLLALVILLVNYYVLDAIDGVLARVSGTSSRRGRAIDLSIDHFYVVPLSLALIFFNMTSPFWVAAYLAMQLTEYFVLYLRYGIEAGKYPFSYGKFFVYAVFVFWAVGAGNWFDYVFIFLSVYLFLKNIFNLVELYYGR